MPGDQDVVKQFLHMYDRMLVGDFEPANRLVSPEFACTNPRRPKIEGIDHMIQSIKEQLQALENMRMEVEFASGCEDSFSLAYTLRGRHVRELFGVPPSGKEIEVLGLTFHELVDGKSVSGWSCSPIVDKLKAAHADSPGLAN